MLTVVLLSVNDNQSKKINERRTWKVLNILNKPNLCKGMANK